ncbi:dihydropyrimidinase [Dethiosulfatibacter aminovorans DSM 17477]|uniref:Dihydropyrimidinase n=1 Tax=Dethiosulfatibacter aminovorans DSM 17477 TaxID=1121476 RepID=A0A1M6HCA9_9FIRM|nr:amidohydrolase family protein [Dethiosulfatibacter aminovorans]SHJ19822.1 dihydropyrimidinase [Dethiosulfatibacter aminovorans DSM 17477]
MFDLGIVKGKVYLDGKFAETNVYIRDGSIEKVSDEELDCERTLDAKGRLVLPGFIDPHVHFSLDLGEFSSRDDFESGSRAAAFGGVTTFLDFTRPIHNHDEALEAIRERKKEAVKSCVDYSLHLTLGNFSGDVEKLVGICREEGLGSIKVFTAYSESNRRCSYEVIERILKKDILLMSHSEEDELVSPVWDEVATYEESRPVEAEMTAVERLCISASSKGRLYIVHVSSGSTVEMVKDKFGQFLNRSIFLESCPHYFNLSSDLYGKENGRIYLMAPPLRSKDEVKKMKENIGFLSTVGTDHCPFMKEEKLKYERADKVPKGIGSIEYSFSLMYTLFGNEIIPKFTSSPAEIFGLRKKGRIAEGFDGDIVVYDENISREIDGGVSKCDYSVYEGKETRGKVVTTISGGRIIMDDGTFYGGRGRFIRR